MKDSSSSTLFTWRYVAVASLLLLALGGLTWRLVLLSIFQSDFLRKQGNARVLRTVSVPAYRGIISDRNGEPLAISTPVKSIWVDPQNVDLQNPDIHELAQLLKLSKKFLISRINRVKSREFLYLKRGITPMLANKIEALDIPGVYTQTEFKRYYPGGKFLAHIIGMTNVDDQGQEGIELAYDDWLQGVAGKKQVLKDRMGHVIDNVNVLSEPKPGHNLMLSIDRRIQYLVFKELSKTITEYHARSGSVVVLDAESGEILAMVNLPTYNPNKPMKNADGRYRNRGVTDVFEPGSVLKTFSIASALDNGKIKTNTMINTSPGFLTLDGNKITDEHPHGLISVKEIFQLSSNVGVTKIALKLKPEQLLKTLKEVGFASRTGSAFPGESAGVIREYAVWHDFTLATLAFGYGISVTPLQLARAFTVFANAGRLLPVSFMRQDEAPVGKRVFSPHVAASMLDLLASVVSSKGTGRSARVPGYKAAGKTGTPRIAGPHGYSKDRHIATFVGLAPVDRPRVIVAVVIKDPRSGTYYASRVAAPLFSKVMSETLHILDVPPDKNYV